MATLSVTFAAGSQQGAQIRKLAQRIKEAAIAFPDNVPGQALTLVIDNAPPNATASVQITSTGQSSAVYTV